ncbi:MAG: hypothetical protein K0R48_33 [Gammaproteobacteria bacterium]|jgi:hypothetical protein|nr:hypothetical protein [Gammaproteobacteria bacterium]
MAYVRFFQNVLSEEIAKGLDDAFKLIETNLKTAPHAP